MSCVAEVDLVCYPSYTSIAKRRISWSMAQRRPLLIGGAAEGEQPLKRSWAMSEIKDVFYLNDTTNKLHLPLSQTNTGMIPLNV